MGLFPFGKKDKKPTDSNDAEGQVPSSPSVPTPPKLQAPPVPGGVRPPVPGASKPSGGTQPLILPRNAPPGASPKLSRNTPAQVRSTQRIVLPSAPTASASGTMRLTPATNASIALPAGMFLRNFPEQILSAPLAQLESTGQAGREVSVPLNLILPQLPSGKIELPLQDIQSFFPADLLQPAETLAAYAAQPISLPLMDVVMRIPSDMLALRPDQKEVDASIVNMADPFTEELLREQAEAARKEAEAKIIEENQVPNQEEFVPQAEAKRLTPAPIRGPLQVTATSPISAGPNVVPAPALPTRPNPARPAAMPPTSSPSAAQKTAVIPLSALPGGGVPKGPTSAFPPAPPPPPSPLPSASAATLPPTPPMPPVTKAAPTAIPALRAPIPKAPTTAPSLNVAPASRATNAPTRSTAPVPARLGTVPVPPIAPPPPIVPPPPEVQPEPEPEPEPQEANLEPEIQEQGYPHQEEPKAEVPPTEASGNDDLARLAALAMAELGEEDASEEQDLLHAGDTTPLEKAQLPSPSASETKPSFKFTAPTPPQPAAPPAPNFLSKTKTSALSSETSSGAWQSAHAPAPLNLNTATVDQLASIPGLGRTIAQDIVVYRETITAFRRLEELLDVPSMTAEAYGILTGIDPTQNPLSINELLGFPPEQEINLKDVIERISCWPDVVGCVLSSHRGLPLVGEVPDGLDKLALVAFAPRMFESLNKSFKEISTHETDELIIPTSDISYHILRKDEIYLIILSKVHQLPSRHLQVARYVLANLNTTSV